MQDDVLSYQVSEEKFANWSWLSPNQVTSQAHGDNHVVPVLWTPELPINVSVCVWMP